MHAHAARWPKRRSSGFVFLELLVVLVVIAILMGGYFGRNKDAKNDQSTYQTSIGRSNNAACLANRSALRTQIEMFRINNPNVEITTENLQKAGYNVPTCPQGGVYGFTEGRIICSKHPDKP